MKSICEHLELAQPKIQDAIFYVPNFGFPAVLDPCRCLWTSAGYLFIIILTVDFSPSDT